MKKLPVLLLLSCLIACQQKQYFDSSPEIDIVKNGVKAIFDKDWAKFRSIYADTAKIAANVWSPDKFMNLDQHIESEKSFFETFNEIKISDDIIYSMIITDKGEKWVLMWFSLTAKTKAGAPISTTVHEGLRFVGDKVVFHFSTYNELPIYLAMQPADSVASK